jgi:arylsulfatase A-like enzyme
LTCPPSPLAPIDIARSPLRAASVQIVDLGDPPRVISPNAAKASSHPLPNRKVAGLALWGAFAAALVGCGPQAPARSLIIICIDTLRADHVSSYGYGRETTPVVDALAATGARFETVLSTSNWTVPAVASVFTSALPSRHGAGVPGDVRNLDDTLPTPIAPGLPSLAEILKAQGFRTGLFSANPILYGSFLRSFDVALVNRLPGADLADAALEWISQRPRERTFLYLHFIDVHQPNLPPEPYFSYFETPGSGPRDARHSDWSYGTVTDSSDPAFLDFRANRVAAYDGSIRYVDAQIGRLLERIEALGILRHAVVVVYSDHGEEFWDHAPEQASQRDDPREIWGIGHGHSMYQELLRVPLIVHRGDRSTGAVIDCPVSLLDLAPTALGLLDVEAPATMEGRDLGGWLDGIQDCPRRSLVAESPAYGPDSAALVDWPTKLVKRGGSTRLFALDRDPGERIGLSAEEAPASRWMETALSRSTRRTAVPGIAAEVDPETLRQLRALGYLNP